VPAGTKMSKPRTMRPMTPVLRLRRKRFIVSSWRSLRRGQRPGELPQRVETDLNGGRVRARQGVPGRSALLLRVDIYALNSAAWSVAHSKKVRGGAPVSSATVDVTNAG
jgi:hypothetical protein